MGRCAAIVLCISVVILVALGLVMLASTSAWVHGVDKDPYLLVKRQGIFAGVGIAMALIVGSLDTESCAGSGFHYLSLAVRC